MARVHWFPTEYLTYGLGSTPFTSYKPFAIDDATYYIADHLGNTRVTLSSNGNVVSAKDFEPFGKELHSNGTDRLTFIGKEKDVENDLGNFGVRKYEAEYGRFLSIDPLWEKYKGWNTYQYSLNNPLLLFDNSGEYVQAIGTDAQNAVRMSVPEAFRDAIQFNDDGFLQIKPLKEAANGQDENSNIAILSRLAENNLTATVSVADEFQYKSRETGQIETTKFSQIDPDKRVYSGITLMPEKDREVADIQRVNRLSPDGITHIIIRPDQPGKFTIGGSTAHELMGHFRYLILSKLGKAAGARHSRDNEPPNKVDRACKKAEEEAKK